MTYQEWLEKIKILSSNQNNLGILEELEKEPINENILEMLIPKIQELITIKTNNSIKNIMINLEIIFTDVNELDYTLVKFKKEIAFINRIINLKQIPPHIQNNIKKSFKDDINEVYGILKKEADIIDYTGSYNQIIKNNEYKWSE